MRTKLGRIAACTTMVAAIAGSIALASGTDVAAQTGTTEPTTTSTTTTTTTTIPMVGDVGQTPDRGTWAQATETVPAPATTTTTTIPPTQLPENSGTGRRVVYSKSRQRVWAVEANGTVTRTYLVSGRLTWNQPTPNNLSRTDEPAFQYYSNPPGFYRVDNRSGFTCNIKNNSICWRYMIRFTKGPDGDNIGLHEIPKKNGVPVQSVSQLGQPLSNGCVRQATPDAEFMWNWAWVGTKVVVLA